ncbi:MAG: hypothetical protein NVS4B8_11490 [Herpetosiphon sp.]
MTVQLVLDASRSMEWGTPSKLRAASQLLGALGYIALVGADRVATAAWSDNRLASLPAQRGRRGALPLFQFLLGINAAGPTTFATLCNSVLAATHRPGPLLLCSDLLDETALDGLSALAARGFEVTVLHVLAADELNPQLDGDLRLLDSEGGPAIDLSLDPDLLVRYRERVARWREDLASGCKNHAITYIPFTTDLPIEPLIVELLRRRIIH